MSGMASWGQQNYQWPRCGLKTQPPTGRRPMPYPFPGLSSWRPVPRYCSLQHNQEKLVFILMPSGRNPELCHVSNQFHLVSSHRYATLCCHASTSWRLPCFGDGSTKLGILKSIHRIRRFGASVPAFWAGKGSLTPASPRREASLYTCPRRIAGGFFL